MPASEWTQGEIQRSRHFRIAAFTQHHMDQLDLSLSPLEYMFNMAKETEPDITVDEVRRRIGKFKITGGFQTQRMELLSGVTFVWLCACYAFILWSGLAQRFSSSCLWHELLLVTIIYSLRSFGTQFDFGVAIYNSLIACAFCTHKPQTAGCIALHGHYTHYENACTSMHMHARACLTLDAPVSLIDGTNMPIPFLQVDRSRE